MRSKWKYIESIRDLSIPIFLFTYERLRFCKKLNLPFPRCDAYNAFEKKTYFQYPTVNTISLVANVITLHRNRRIFIGISLQYNQHFKKKNFLIYIGSEARKGRCGHRIRKSHLLPLT